MTRISKGLLAEPLLGNTGVGIPTYARDNNSTLAYQVDSANTVTNAKRFNEFLDSNRGD